MPKIKYPREIKSKICRVCDNEKGIDDFDKNRRVCRPCRALQNRSDYVKNVDKFRTYYKEKIKNVCGCGGSYNKMTEADKIRHENTNKHKKYVELVKEKELNEKNKALTKMVEMLGDNTELIEQLKNNIEIN